MSSWVPYNMTLAGWGMVCMGSRTPLKNELSAPGTYVGLDTSPHTKKEERLAKQENDETILGKRACLGVLGKGGLCRVLYNAHPAIDVCTATMSNALHCSTTPTGTAWYR
jgi:hypothetical protein